jgi:RimJ/RimL family protein N-acetyltransferase
VELQTERLLIREWRPDDDSELTTAYDIYRRAEVTRWLGGGGTPWADLPESRQHLERWQSVARAQPGYGLWAVVPDKVGHPVGTVLLVHLADADGRLTDDVEVGWHFHPEHWGRGYATESAVAVLSHAFTTLSLGVVNAIAYPDNAPSLAVMRRLGMTHRGETSRWYGATFDWWTVDRLGFEGRPPRQPVGPAGGPRGSSWGAGGSSGGTVGAPSDAGSSAT